MKDEEVINNYIKEQDFFKRSTSKDIKQGYYSIINDGVMSNDGAIGIIRLVVNAIRNEYGE